MENERVRAPYLRINNKTSRYYGHIVYNKKVYTTKPHREKAKDALRDIEQLKEKIAKIKAKDRDGRAKNVAPLRDHPLPGVKGSLPKNIQYEKRTNRYFGSLMYKRKVYTTKPTRLDMEDALRDLELLNAKIAKLKASEKIKHSKTFVAYKDQSHPYLINLTNNDNEVVAQAAVSEEDYERVKAMKWHLQQVGHAAGKVMGVVNIRMHHFIVGKPSDGYVVDHLDGNPLNNTRENLRHATHSQNMQNAIRKRGNDYIGVQPSGSKYGARYSKTHLGYFDTKEEAARMYDIYVFQKLGLGSLTNGLISYEEAMAIRVCLPSELKKKRREGLPRGVYRDGKSFFCCVSYEGVIRRSQRVRTIDLALQELEKIRSDIEPLIRQNAELQAQRSIDRNSDGQAVIRTTKGEVILVDEDMWHELMRYKWHASRTGYASGYVNGSNIYMHRHIVYLKTGTEIPKKMMVDHINNQSLDNRSKNLRVADCVLNNHNRSRKGAGTSKYKGVVKIKTRYRAMIQKDGITYRLGTFSTEREAAIAYNIKAMELHGENARLNIIKDEDTSAVECV